MNSTGGFNQNAKGYNNCLKHFVLRSIIEWPILIEYPFKETDLDQSKTYLLENQAHCDPLDGRVGLCDT